jgi:hypothetical protein
LPFDPRLLILGFFGYGSENEGLMVKIRESRALLGSPTLAFMVIDLAPVRLVGSECWRIKTQDPFSALNIAAFLVPHQIPVPE